MVGIVLGAWGRRHALNAVILVLFHLLPWIAPFQLWRQGLARGTGFIVEEDWADVRAARQRDRLAGRARHRRARAMEVRRVDAASVGEVVMQGRPSCA